MKEITVEKTSSNGIAIGKALIFTKEAYEATDYEILAEDKSAEKEKFVAAVEKAAEELTELAQSSEIFEAHLMLVNDDMLRQSVIDKVEQENKNIEQALDKVCEEYYEVFRTMEDEYMRERAADIVDIRNRLMRILQNKPESDLSTLKEPVIIIAKDLTPSDTATMSLEKVLGFITQEGGVTSHVSIMAKSMGIPALVGVEGILKEITTSKEIIMDAGKGKIFIDPDSEMKERYRKLQEKYEEEVRELALLEGKEAVTTDGRSVLLYANAGNVEDVERAAAQKVYGIGLFRSEFLYMENSHFPTEEEQFEVYKKAAVLAKEELTIRTLDIGGDKSLSYFEFEKEENPFLGWRAIRISLAMKDIFKEQLRAILRASAFGKVRIMYPMIISVEELEEANRILLECKNELDKEKKEYDRQIKVGMMMETPASVMLAEELAARVDFFSIGTNDLTQYILAVDRGNKKISKLYNSCHPAVLKAIAHIIKAAHKQDIPVGMCGEFAGDIKAAKLLLGMGLDEFSMSLGQINRVKKVILETSREEAEKYAATVLSHDHTISI